MERPARSSSRRGLLLVEAILASIVIAVGLVFISRGLSNQLKVLQSIEDYDVLTSLAQNKLLELEGKRFAGRPLTEQDREGAFEPPYDRYRWMMAAVARETPAGMDGKPTAKNIAITVQRSDRPSSTATLSAIWPSAWVPNAW